MIPLFVPGPVTVDPAVLAAQALQPVYHRGEQYGLMLRDISAMLCETLGTTGEVYCVSGAGTACLETAIQNPCRPGDRVVVASNGYFGERLATLCQRLDLDTVHIRAHYSEPLPLQQIDHALRTPAVALLVVHHETSTGRINDLAALGDMSRSRAAVCIVDAIASAGTLSVDMDKNGLDVVIASSQKGLGGTPGAGVLAISPHAWARVEARGAPKTLAGDWQRIRRSFHRDPPESLWTPPVSVMTGLHAALEQLTRRQPFAQVQAHRAAIGRALLAGLTACGFKPWPSGCADVAPITVVEPPPGIDADGLIRAINDRYGVQVGAGLGQLAGRILRVSHIGIELFHVFGLLGALSVASGAAGDAAAAEASRAYAETIAERATA